MLKRLKISSKQKLPLSQPSATDPALSRRLNTGASAGGTGGTSAGDTVPDLDELLAAEVTTRKKFLSQFRWFHDRQRISSRQTAETKLKLSSGGGDAVKAAGCKNKLGDDVIFLVRGSMICEDDYIISILAGQKCYHYQIQLTPHSEYLLVSVEIAANEQVRFRGLKELIDTLRKPDQYLTYIPVLTMPCPGGGVYS